MPRRSTDAIASAIDDWRRQLIDIGGRNRLLYYRPQRAATLDFDLAAASAAPALERLIAGDSVKLRLSDCAPGDPEDAARRARAIRSKAREHEQEQGIDTLFLALHAATWQAERSPNAPLLLARAALEPIGRRAEDFQISRVDEWQLNPSLIHLLRTEHGVDLEAPALREPLAAALEQDDHQSASQIVIAACAEVPGFDLSEALVLSCFSYAKLPMVHDLADAADAAAAHPIVAAIAGDRAARDALRQAAVSLGGSGDRPLDAVAPDDEFLILDADGSQSRVLDAAVQGRNLVVVGPPGTGKSQTIANLIASLTARGKSTLFVAEKRAAIDAVKRRLVDVGLSDIILDLHEGARRRRETAQQLNAALQAARDAPAPDLSDTHRALTRSRRALINAADAIHRAREPWGVSVYRLYSELLEVDDAHRTEFRITNSVRLRELTPEALDVAGEDLAEYISRGGSLLDCDARHPWSCAHREAAVASEEHRAAVDGALNELFDTELDKYQQARQALAAELDIKPPHTFEQVRSLLELIRDIEILLQSLQLRAFDADLETLHADLAPADGGLLTRLFASLFNGGYGRARNSAAALSTGPPAAAGELRAHLGRARELLARWRQLQTGSTFPKSWGSAAALTTALDRLEKRTAIVEEHALLPKTQTMSWPDLIAMLEALHAERGMLRRLPRLNELRASLDQRGLQRLLRLATDQGWDAVRARLSLRHAWLESVLNEINIDDDILDSFNTRRQDAAINDFCSADREHISRGAERVRRRWAEHAVAARDAHPAESELIAREARKKSRHLSTRNLVLQAPNVLRALKPCWAMSPLVVSQLLPARINDGEPMFDVVVFDEASQILPADAIPSLLRGRQAVVAGDPKQLPPTTFFTTLSDDPAEEEAEEDELAGEALTTDYESLLDVMQALSPGGTRTLEWHYRSRDERLIAFSNHHVYDGSLTTFPGALPDDCINHVEVPFSEDAITRGATNSAEVREVVDLILKHAAERPHETLGVIAMGIKHAHRIEETLRLTRAEHPELDEFFTEAGSEPFFVKSLERVQGDERDAIIISIGYGRSEGGRMRYGFGPINREGGYRRLNVAITRAKRRLTLVSTFGAETMDPDRLRSEGARMLREYIAYCASRGRNLGSRQRSEVPLNPFEIDIKEQLEARGVPLQPQYGASGYRIDFAAMHPVQAGRPVLAIEADGASYHSSLSARDRDRLRQEHLERLGWSFHRIWSTAWFSDRETEVDKAVRAWERAIARSSAPPERPEPQAAAPEPSQAEPPTPPKRSAPKPRLRKGEPIAAYSAAALVRLVKWIESDGRLRTEGELLSECITELGYSRRGSRIVSALKAAIADARGESAPSSKPRFTIAPPDAYARRRG